MNIRVGMGLVEWSWWRLECLLGWSTASVRKQALIEIEMGFNQVGGGLWYSCYSEVFIISLGVKRIT